MIVVYDMALGCLDLNPLGKLWHGVSVPQFAHRETGMITHVAIGLRVK